MHQGDISLGTGTPSSSSFNHSVTSDLTSLQLINSLPTSDSVFTTGTFSDIVDGDISSKVHDTDTDDDVRTTINPRRQQNNMVVSPSSTSDVTSYVDSPPLPAKTKWCIEKEYVHVIYVDHSKLDEELEKRLALSAELARCEANVANSESLRRPSTKAHHKHSSSASGTPAESRGNTSSRPSGRKMLTGESIRRLMKMVSPGSRRRRSPDVLHSSGSSLSGDTVTGSTRSLSGGCELSDAKSPSSSDPATNN